MYLLSNLLLSQTGIPVSEMNDCDNLTKYFMNKHSIPGGTFALAKNGKLIYVSGETISIDLDQLLLKEGYNIKRIINYRSIHNEKFDENFVEALKSNMPDMVYVYSQNSAYSYLKFIKNYQLESPVSYTHLTLPTICSV